MAVVTAFLSYFLLPLVPSQVYASGRAGSLLFTNAGEKNPATRSMGLEKHCGKHLLGFIYAQLHSISPLLNQVLQGYCNTSNKQ